MRQKFTNQATAQDVNIKKCKTAVNHCKQMDWLIGWWNSNFCLVEILVMWFISHTPRQPCVHKLSLNQLIVWFCFDSSEFWLLISAYFLWLTSHIESKWVKFSVSRCANQSTNAVVSILCMWILFLNYTHFVLHHFTLFKSMTYCVMAWFSKFCLRKIKFLFRE